MFCKSFLKRSDSLGNNLCVFGARKKEDAEEQIFLILKTLTMNIIGEPLLSKLILVTMDEWVF